MLNLLKSVLIISIFTCATQGVAASKDLKILSDLAYGDDAKQTLDVYIPENSKNAPVIFMVHGGAWSWGDKAHKAEFENKVAHWVTKGFIFVSTNYRTLPEVKPVEQTYDLEKSLIYAQKHVKKWGGSPEKFILMGHSSGAHLVSLLSANFPKAIKKGAKPWLATVSLDISGYNIVKKLAGDSPSEFYLEKFGAVPEYWEMASPFYAITSKIPPFLAVCSTRSQDACSQAEDFLVKAKTFGSKTQLLPIDMSHGEINSELGKNACYTLGVDRFISGLGQDLADMVDVSQYSPKDACKDI